MSAEVEKGFLTFENEEPNVRLSFLFNPESIELTRNNSWEAPTGAKTMGKLAFNGQTNGTLTFTLYFDTTHDGKPVTRYTSVLLDKMQPDSSLPESDETKGNVRPPWVMLHWGEFVSFKAVIDTATVNFLYFSSTGIPLRASVVLVLKQYQADNAFLRQNPTSGTPHPHRTHRVQRGETLDRISARYYGDPTRWRVLAAANGIEDPLAIRPGSLIGIPQTGT